MKRRGMYQLELVAALTLIGGICLVSVLAVLGIERPAATREDWKDAGPGVTTLEKKRVASTLTTPSNSMLSADLPHYVGIAAGGCAAANCHGGVRAPYENGQPRPADEWKTSAFDFLQHDPHAQAYNVLFEERSREMIDRLARGDEALANAEHKPPNKRTDVLWYAAQLQTRCVSCHATPLPPGTPTAPQGTLNHYALGVTCEACHGPASQWGDQHVSSRWQTSSSAEVQNPIDKKATGFNELQDLSISAATCARCHIGDGSQVDGKSYREVTHDLIAAGHPRLDFDFAAWYASMPAHWNQEREKRTGFSMEAWAHGQAEALKTRSRLVAFKYENWRSTASQATPHPSGELALYDCFACHQSLRFPPRQQGTRPLQSNGLPFGSAWIAFTSAYPERAVYGNEQIRFLLEAQPSPEFEDYYEPALDLTNVPRRLEKCPPYENWDELLSWYYAADAVSRDAAFAAQSSLDLRSSATTLETSLQQLKSEMEKYLARDGEVSRYASPSGFGVAKSDADDSEKPDPQAVQIAFEEAKRALSVLAAKWSP